MGKTLHPDLEKMVISEEELKVRIAELGQEITSRYAGLDVLLVGILKGASIFYADLVREIDLPVHFDFMTVSSYGASTETTGSVRIIKDLEEDITGRHVVLVEDILDTGLTLFNLKNLMLARNPASVSICTLLDKPERRRASIEADYVGFVVPDMFLVGYGLDFDQNYRNLPYVGVLKPKTNCK